jgi:alcohol dehydrogenase
MTRAGICCTDLEITRGYMGYRGVLGHELLGIVEACDDPQLVGRRVVAEINLGCGHCRACAADLARHCAKRTVLGIVGKDGCHAECVTLPTGNLHVVPDEVTDDRAVFAEPLAAAFEILEQVHVAPDERVLVLGDGKLGLLATMVLSTAGADTTLVGRHPHKLAIAESAGARASTEVPAVAGFDVVVEATGNAAGLATALGAVRPRGTVVLKSTYHGRPAVDTARIVIDEIRVVGSRCGRFGPALRSLASGRIDPKPLVEETYALADGVVAYEHAARKGALKVCLVP